MTTSDRYKNNELLFHQKIQSQLSAVRALLNTPIAASSGQFAPTHQRSPVYFADYAKHSYQDKFGLAEYLTNVAIAAQMNILDVLGVDEEKFKLMHRIVNGGKGNEHDEYSNCNTLILRLAAEEHCVAYDAEDVPSYDSSDPSTPGKPRGKSVERGKLQRRQSNDSLPVREGPFFTKRRAPKEPKEENNFWKVSVIYSIKVIATQSVQNVAFKDPPSLPLKSRTAETILQTAKEAPRPLQLKVVRDSIDFDLTWLFKNISSEDFSCNFSIDQSHKNCTTPRRNKDIDAAVKYFSELEGWCNDVCTYFLKGTCWNVDLNSTTATTTQSLGSQAGPHESRPLLDIIDADVVFVPVLPIFEPPSSALLRKTDKNAKAMGEIKSLSPLLPIDDVRLFLNEQCRTLDEKIHEVVSNFPPPDNSGSCGSLITSDEATLFLLFSHSASITDYFIEGLQAIEQATVDILTKACGRDAAPRDFDNVIRHNNEKLFCEERYRPREFSVDIRRPNRVPEGSLRVEMTRNDGASGAGAGAGMQDDESWPIVTISKEVTAESGENEGVHIQLPSIASRAKIAGKSYVHGWLTYTFHGQHDFQYQIRTTSRQFSCFMVLTGTISHDQCMNVKNAMIVQNKDEVIIPLTFSRARAVGDFPGLISSLSPQQQTYAQSAREVQLESSVFSVCVIEIKPQLELLLGLPPNSLSKEVKLVKALISLFVDHHISADLVAYDGPEEASWKEKVAEVKQHVKSAQEMVNDIPLEENEEALSAEVSTEDIVEEPRNNNPLFQRNTVSSKDAKSSILSVTSDARLDRDKTPNVSDDNTSLADLFRKRRSEGSGDLNPFLEEIAIREQFIINPFPKSMRRVPSLDYMDSLGRREASNSQITEIPRKLNAKLKALQNKHLQHTAIETGEVWQKRNMLAPKTSGKEIDKAEQEINTKKVMDLLDALSRSGSLPIQYSELHATVAVTHCFSQNLMDTLVLDNVDPIKQLSDSTLLIASVIHDVSLDSFARKQLP